MLSVEIAEYLDGLGLVTFDQAGASGDCFLELLPSQPDQVVAIKMQPGSEPSSKLPYDELGVQILVRGTRDPRTGYNKAMAIYSTLLGLSSFTLPGGTYLVLCNSMQSGPAPLGSDKSGRIEYSLNFQCEIRNVTTHRV